MADAGSLMTEVAGYNQIRTRDSTPSCVGRSVRRSFRPSVTMLRCERFFFAILPLPTRPQLGVPV